jgi:hypothetical protein
MPIATDFPTWRLRLRPLARGLLINPRNTHGVDLRINAPVGTGMSGVSPISNRPLINQDRERFLQVKV